LFSSKHLCPSHLFAKAASLAGGSNLFSLSPGFQKGRKLLVTNSTGPARVLVGPPQQGQPNVRRDPVCRLFSLFFFWFLTGTLVMIFTFGGPGTNQPPTFLVGSFPVSANPLFYGGGVSYSDPYQYCYLSFFTYPGKGDPFFCSPGGPPRKNIPGFLVSSLLPSVLFNPKMLNLHSPVVAWGVFPPFFLFSQNQRRLAVGTTKGLTTFFFLFPRLPSHWVFFPFPLFFLVFFRALQGFPPRLGSINPSWAFTLGLFLFAFFIFSSLEGGGVHFGRVRFQRSTFWKECGFPQAV